MLKNALSAIRSFVRSIIYKDRVEDEMDSELRFHLEMEIAQNIARGMDAMAARRAAMIKFGSLEKTREEVRDIRRSRLSERIVHDARFGARLLWRNPAFTGVALLTLALGIGATSATFSLVNGIILKPLPYKEPARLVQLQDLPYAMKTKPDTMGPIVWRDEYARSFESVGVYNSIGGGVNLTGGPDAERVEASEMSAGLLPTLGIYPLLGRNFTPEDCQTTTAQVAIISHGIWRRYFGGDSGITGKTISINDRPLTVIGVMPADFRFAGKVDIWLPIPPPGAGLLSGNTSSYSMVARLKPEFSLAQARSEMSVVSEQLSQDRANNSLHTEIKVMPLIDDQSLVSKMRADQVKTVLLLLFGAVGLVLLIACANVTNLLLARATTRSKEIAIRAAVGASRGRLIGQMLVESVLLSLLGGALGLVVALGSLRILVLLAPAGVIPHVEEIGLDGRVFAFTTIISLLTGLLFGMAPALQSSRIDLIPSLKEGGWHGGGRGLASFKSLLVVAELGLALTLMIGAGLLIKSFVRVLETNPGFDAHNTLTVAVDLNSSKYRGQAEQRDAFFHQLNDHLRTLPGVEFVGATNNLPMGRTSDFAGFFLLEGESQTTFSFTDLSRVASYISVTPDYFRAMRIPLIKGRLFNDRDVKTSAPVVIVDQRLAEQVWPNENPLGKRLIPPGQATLCEVVGVVSNVLQGGRETQSLHQTYVPYEQSRLKLSTVVIRSTGNPANLVAAVRDQIRALDSGLPVYDIKTMDERLSEDIGQRRFTLLLLAIFAALAMILASVGIYGVMSYTVTHRTHEIGVRMALGAQPHDVMRLFLRQALRLALVGIVIGIGAAVGLTRLMASLLFDVRATDPLTFVGVSLALVIVALVACYVPARRAMKVDPITALRYD